MVLKEKLFSDAVDPHVTQAHLLICINSLSSRNRPKPLTKQRGTTR